MWFGKQVDLANFTLRSALAVVFLAAAVGKASSVSGFSGTLRGLGIPERLLVPATWFLIFTEGLVAVLLMADPLPRAVLLGLGLSTLFTGSSVYALLKRKEVDCACFGRSHTVIGMPTIARSILIAGALAACAITSDRQHPAWIPRDPEEIVVSAMLAFALIQLSRWGLEAPVLLALARNRRGDRRTGTRADELAAQEVSL